MKQRHIVGTIFALAAIAVLASPAAAQIVQRPGVPDVLTNRQPTPPPPAPLPNYIIGPDDVLVVNVWNEKSVSGEVIVRPDGKITLPVGQDIFASGLTVEELKQKVTEELKKGFFDDPTVFIQVKTINSRKVYITGGVNKPGFYTLTGPMTMLQLITSAGGLVDFADKKNIRLISATLRAKDGINPLTLVINYNELVKGTNLAKNNPELRPGDQVIVNIK